MNSRITIVKGGGRFSRHIVLIDWGHPRKTVEFPQLSFGAEVHSELVATVEEWLVLGSMSVSTEYCFIHVYVPH